MPRKPRLDEPGLLHHVIARGIEHRPIFEDDHDRQFFMDRLELVLRETKTLCFAFALVPNHFHLLLRTGKKPIATTMRRLLTSYAVHFNNRHKRAGHLFQNRYKDIVCQEDAYLLELVRYINLNPLKSMLVADVKLLEGFRFCSHNLLVKKTKRPDWFGKDEILGLFARTEQEAVKIYSQFILDGIDQDERPDFEGGGKRRSRGTEKDQVAYDERVLGDSEFVLELLRKENKPINRDESLSNLDGVVVKALELFDLSEAQLIGSSQPSVVTRARAFITYVGTQELGISAAAIARRFGVNRSSVVRLVEKGKRIAEEIEIR